MTGTGKGVDRRIARSRRAILGAFEKLIMDRGLDRITVSAIAQAAGVDRKTFYVHFGTIDAVLDAVAAEIVADVVGKVDEAVAAVKGPDRCRAAMVAFFRALNDVVGYNLELNRRFLESIPIDTLVQRFSRPLSDLVRERGLLSGHMDEDMLEYHLAYLLGGILMLYRSWILSDERVPFDAVTDVALMMTVRGLSGL